MGQPNYFLFFCQHGQFGTTTVVSELAGRGGTAVWGNIDPCWKQQMCFCSNQVCGVHQDLQDWIHWQRMFFVANCKCLKSLKTRCEKTMMHMPMLFFMNLTSQLCDMPAKAMTSWCWSTTWRLLITGAYETLILDNGFLTACVWCAVRRDSLHVFVMIQPWSCFLDVHMLSYLKELKMGRLLPFV